MPSTASSDLFRSGSVVRSLSKADLQRLYYQTSAQSAFQGSQLKEGDKGEEYGEVYDVGHRTTKHWTFPERVAPLLDRTACSYRTDFAAKPMDDTFENNGFAASMRGGVRAPSAPSLGTSSVSRDSFSPEVAQRFRSAAKFSPTNDRQERTKTVGGFGASYERVSKSHRDHRGPHPDFPSKVRTARHPHNMMLAGARPLEYWTTQYQRDAAVCSATTWSATPHVASPQATALGKWSWPPEAARPRVMLALPPSLDPAAPS